MNKIVNKIIEQRNGNYIHALELGGVNELKNAIEILYDEFINEFNDLEILEFFNTISLYYYTEEEESEEEEEKLYAFDIKNYIDNL